VRTKENAEKKLTLTYEEMEAEREEVISYLSPSYIEKKNLSICVLHCSWSPERVILYFQCCSCCYSLMCYLENTNWCGG
jgi:hypothetical protein